MSRVEVEVAIVIAKELQPYVVRRKLTRNEASELGHKITMELSEGGLLNEGRCSLGCGR